MATGTRNSNPPDVVVAALLKQCRQDGGYGYVGRIIRRKGQGERVTAIVLADHEWAYTALVPRRHEVVRYLRVDSAQIQREIVDPVLRKGIQLGGFVVITLALQ